MTYTNKDLRAQGVDEAAITWRAWRRSMYITQAEAAAMAGVPCDWLRDVETGRLSPARRPERMAALRALMARWPEGRVHK